jgi:hypothetical protein
MKNTSLSSQFSGSCGLSHRSALHHLRLIAIFLNTVQLKLVVDGVNFHMTEHKECQSKAVAVTLTNALALVFRIKKRNKQ